MKVFISPDFKGPDKADGGIRRVVEAQRKYLPELGVELVDTAEAADLVAIHAGAGFTTDKPIVAHMHGLYWDEYEWPVWAKRLNADVIRVLHLADAISAPSEWVANAVRHAMWADVEVLHHGISTDEWKVLPKAQRDNYVLWNKTRVDPICDPTPMEEVAAQMHRQKFVSTYCMRQGLDNVTVTGALPYNEAKTLIERAGVYLCTSRETFGIGTIEALASGVPVVGWAWGAQPDIVKHKETGWLCPPGDIGGLQEGIEYCLQYRDELAKAARADVLKRFTWRSAMQKYAAMYERVLRIAAWDRPKVSVVIPCYKLEHYLEQCLESVLRQDVGAEIIVVDDASPTWDSDLEERYRDRVTFVHNEKNLYLAGALNEGFAQADGEYFMALDADNFLAPGTLATLTSELDKHRYLDIVYGAVKFINPDGSADTGVSPDGISKWPFEQFSYRQQMLHQNQIPSTCLFRRWVWERSGGYRRRYRTGEDADYWCRATSLGAIPAKVTDAVTLVYRQRADSMSRSNTQARWEDWYPWSADPSLTPFAAPRDDAEYPNVQACDPAVVTVVIPVGPGHEEIVVDAVDSVVAQTYQKWRVVVVNDSGKPLARLPAFVHTVNTTGSTGPANARNVGIAEVTTPYFLLLDADDIIVPEALQAFVDAARPDLYVYSDWVVHETGEVKVTDEWSVQALKQTMFHAVTCLYPTKAWSATGGFDTALNAWEDYDFLIALCVKGYCGVRVPKPLLQYRIRSGTVREKMYAQKDTALAAMRAKWTEEDFMACGACAQRAQQAQQQAQTQQGLMRTFSQVVNQRDTSNLVQVEFILGERSARTYRGAVTGQEYTFSADESVQYVYADDVSAFLERPREFRLYTGEAVPA